MSFLTALAHGRNVAHYTRTQLDGMISYCHSPQEDALAACFTI